MPRPPRRRRPSRRSPLAAALFAAAAGTACGGDIEEEKTGAAAVRPLLDRYCVDCHGEYYAENEFRLDAGALDLSGELTGASLAALVKVHDRLRAGEMPPADADAPSAADRAATPSPGLPRRCTPPTSTGSAARAAPGCGGSRGASTSTPSATCWG